MMWEIFGRPKSPSSIVQKIGEVAGKPGQLGELSPAPIHILTSFYNEFVARILAIEDSPDFQMLIIHALGSDHQLTLLGDGSSLQEEALKIAPDLILLDVDLPGFNGFELAALLKESPQTRDIPILFLTAHQEVEFMTHGLKLGAEDYLFKPIRPDELKLRCGARLLKLREHKESHGVLRSGTLTLDLITRTTVIEQGNTRETLQLSPFECQILAVFIQNEGGVLSRAEILKLLHEDKSPTVLDNHIGSLKKKSPFLGDAIETIYGVGYAFKRKSAG